MATDSSKQTFYGEVDRFRYRTNWGCFGWLIIIVFILALAVGWVWYKH